MPSIPDTIARLTQQRGAIAGNPMREGVGALQELAAFGSNPGALRARTYVPKGLAGHVPLVVVLHGCTQSAAGYDLGSGWSQLADRHGFALLFAEQQRQNNPNLCFNWFSPEDTRRGSGEALSIRQMIGAMTERHDIDPARIFVTGLSAGGAMAAVMLAAYPELFAGGAIIAGLPYGTASTVSQAFDRMRGHGVPAAAALAGLVRGASDHQGPWPILSVWQGSADTTVRPTLADALVAQWCALHGVGVEPSRTETVAGYPHRVWCDDRGRVVIEAYSITGLGHGTPLDTIAEDGCGKSGAFMLEANISSTDRICRFWGLAVEGSGIADVSREPSPASRELASATDHDKAGETRFTRVHAARPTSKPPRTATGVNKVIEEALRAAGLML